MLTHISAYYLTARKNIKGTKEVVVYWEYNRGQPKLYNYSKLIEVFGSLPFEIDTSTLGGKNIAYWYTKGLRRREV